MIKVGIYIYVDDETDLSNEIISDFNSRVITDGGVFEQANCLNTTIQSLGSSFGIRNIAKRIKLFDDEKISIKSSVQQISDISKTFTDFSQTFTVPATKNNNKIFKHWYENSLDTQFSTVTKTNAYIELDTIPFRVGKIQLEGCDIKNGQAQSYSITFIGNLVNLKDSFAGLLLNNLDSIAYDIPYSADIVKDKLTKTNTSADVMFPLISSNRYWNYDAGGDDDITVNSHPIRFNELFPAIRIKRVFNMIEDKFNINLQGTTENPSTFLSDPKFTNAYLYLKKEEEFKSNLYQQIDFTTKGNLEDLSGTSVNLTENYFIRAKGGGTKITITPQSGFTNVPYTVYRYLNGERWGTYASTTGGTSVFNIRTDADNKKHSFYIQTNAPFQFVFKIDMGAFTTYTKSATMSAQILPTNISISTYFPEIKIEDFFSGILKMFNLTCFSSDGINYTIDTLENYYNSGSIVDISQYIKTDKTNLTRVNTFKKINFLYEKSESLVNEGFFAANNINYGDLLFSTNNEGEDYSIKLPFEDLNFNNLKDKLQVGYILKSDLQKYIPKPIILYDYNPTALTVLTGTHFHFSNSTTGNGTAHTEYKAFGQEYFDGTNTYSLNFPEQQSTLTNEIIDNSLYQTYYANYIANIFNYRARLIKVSVILPIPVLSTLNLNDRIIIRDKRYIINSFTTDLTTGEVQFELITDLRTL